MIKYNSKQERFSKLLQNILRKIERPTKKSGLTSEPTEAKIIHYTIIRTPKWFLELIHSFLESSIYNNKYFNRKRKFTSENLKWPPLLL